MMSGNVHAQSIYEKYNIYRNPVKVFLNKFSITATTGYGATTYKHNLSGMYFFQDASSQFIFSNTELPGSTIIGYTNWLNNPDVGVETSVQDLFDVPFNYLENPVHNPLLGPQQILLNTDSVDVGFKGTSHGIPFLLSVHYNILDFRIGGGFMYEKQFVRDLKPTILENQIRSYEPNFKSTRYTKWFGLVGYRFYQFWSYDFVAELQVGKISAGKQFNKSVIERGLYTNFGISIENNWSEYFRVVIRPSIDFRKYTINLPDGQTIDHKTPAFFIQAGISINIPDIPRSPMKSDHVQLKHVYTDPQTGRLMEVRGQPIWKRQNPKVGENHRRLWRYKRKNKKKLNPY
ncbi:MAG: hypothetical protein RIM99_09710 [Cyclobacteriaceae bacterium]